MRASARRDPARRAMNVGCTRREQDEGASVKHSPGGGFFRLPLRGNNDATALLPRGNIRLRTALRRISDGRTDRSAARRDYDNRYAR